MRSWGGGLVLLRSSPILTNCTISGNSADGGGGVLCWDSSFPILTNCTVSGNSARLGGGVCCDESTSPNLTNCIVWGNNPESVCGGLSFCLTDQDPLFVKAGAWEECHPRLGAECVPYQWDPQTGQPTAWHRWVFDYHLQTNSPCIDAGTSNGAPATDIAGTARPCGTGIDIGAYEYCGGGPPLPRFLRGDANASNAIDIADAIFTLSYLFAHGPVPSCLDAADANDSGGIDIADAITILSHLFAQAGPLPAPFGECGVDPTTTDDTLDCSSFPPCGN